MRSCPRLDGRCFFGRFRGRRGGFVTNRDGPLTIWRMPTAAPSLATCLRCGLTQRLTPPPRGYSARCAAAPAVLPRPRRFGAISPARACALAALVLYPAAVALPVIELNKLGHVRPVTIWSGAVELMAGGQVAVGLLVFICSIVIPILKIIGILALDSERLWRTARARRAVHRAIDWIGRWSMLDVLLIALLVAAIKLGNWAT